MAERKTRKGPASGRKTKAQAEFERHKAELDAGRAAMSSAAGASGGTVVQPTAFPQAVAAVPSWALPPSMATMPQAPGAPITSPAAMQATVDGSGSLSQRLSATLRLGVDVVNASLAGSLRVLDGVSGMAPAYGGAAWHYPGYGAACCDPCVTECGGYDCCCYFGCGCGCCQPSVGSCC